MPHIIGANESQASEVLRPAEAMALLKISRATFWRMVWREELPVVRLGKAVRVPRAQLWKWIEKQAEVRG